MILRRTVPDKSVVEIADLQALRHVLRDLPLPPHCAIVNLVVDRRGRFFGGTGSSRDISNALDYQGLMALREKSGLILCSANTARVEHYRRSKFAPLLLLSLSGNFDGIPAVESPEAGPTNSIVYLAAAEAKAASLAERYPGTWIRVVSLGEMERILAASKLTVIEAGPSLAKQLIADGNASELAITITGVRWWHHWALCKTLKRLGVADADATFVARVEDTVFCRLSVNERVPAPK